MSRPKLSAQPRTTQGKAVQQLRRDGLLPGVIYGNKKESTAIQIDAREFDVLRRTSGRNAMLDLALDGGRPQPVLLHAIQEHPVTRRALHIDLLAVDMTEERTVDVPIVTTGSAPAVERLGGVLLHLRDAVQVRALPDDLPPNLTLDISSLENFELVLHASALELPDGVTLVTDPEEALARVQPPRVEEAAEPTAEEAAEEGAEPAAEEGAQPAAEAGETAEGGAEEPAE